MDELTLPSVTTLMQNTHSKSCWKRCITKILGTRAYLHLLDQAEVKSDLEQLSMCEPNFLVPSPIWGVTYCAEHLHLITRSNFRVRLLLGCHGLESDASRFNSRSNGRGRGDPSCKLCYAQVKDATHFISCPLLEAKRRELLSHSPPQFQDIDTDMDLPDPARNPVSCENGAPQLFANVMLGIDWIEDIDVQAFRINFLAELKALRAELIAQT